MAAHVPFQPITGSTSGRSVAVAVTISSSNAGVVTLSSSIAFSPTLLVTNTSNTTLYVRFSTESVPVATSGDVPIVGPKQRVFSNPVPLGTLGIAVTGSVNGSGTNQGSIVITPGQGGI